MLFPFNLHSSSLILSPMNDAFNYVAVLVSIVIGLGITRVLGQLSEIVQRQNRSRRYWVHTLWIIALFNGLTLNWWVTYRWRVAPHWNFFLFLWVMIPGVLLYLACGVFCPGELASTGAKDWREYYYDNRRGFFSFLAAIWPLDIIDTLLKGKQHFIEQGVLYLPTIALWTLGAVVAATTRNERYHQIWSILFLVSTLSYTTVVLVNLG